MSKRRKRVVLTFWLAAWCALDVWLAVCGERWNTSGISGGIFVGKYVCGQTLAGLGGRHWLHGLWMALGLLAISMLVEMTAGLGVEMLEAFWLLPLALLMGAIPLWGLRFWRGWMIATPDAVGRRSRLRISDMMIVMALLPAAMSLVPFFQLARRHPTTDWNHVFEASRTGFMMGALVVPGIVWLLRGCQRSRKLSIALPIVMGSIVLALGRTSPETRALGVGCSLTIGVPFFFLAALRLIDVRFIRVTEQASTGDEPDSDAKSVWLTIIAALVIAATLNVTSLRMRAQAAERRKAADLAEKHEKLSTGKAKASLSLDFPATNEDLRSFLRHRDVVQLHLHGRSFNDESLTIVKQFSALQVLTLSDTKITDEGLEQLRNLPKLSDLRLQGCPILGEGLSNFTSLTTLTFNRTGVNSQTVRRLSRLPLVSLSIYEAAVDDMAFDGVEFPQLKFLVVQKTRVTGKTMRLPSLEVLLASDSHVDDAGLAELAGSKRLASLDLSRTRITSDCAIALAALPNLHSVELAETAFSDAGLTLLERHLRTDQNRRFGINLSGTRITDAGLPDLAQLDFKSVNLVDTQVTAAGILRTEGLRDRSLMIRAKRCTHHELMRLRRFCEICPL